MSVSALSSQTQNQIDPLTGKVGPSTSTSSTSSSTAAASSTGGTSSLANESTFLTLLVAQLKNQDPEQPADGTQFVTQLAQFTTLEQNLAMRTDLDSIDKKTPAITAAAAATAATGSNPVSNS